VAAALLRSLDGAGESNRPVEDWGKLLGDAAAVTALLDRLLHRRWRTKLAGDLHSEAAAR